MMRVLKIFCACVVFAFLALPTAMAQLEVDSSGVGLDVPSSNILPDTPADDIVDELLYETLPWIDETVVEPIVGAYLPDTGEVNVTIGYGMEIPEPVALEALSAPCGQARDEFHDAGGKSNSAGDSSTNHEFDVLGESGECAETRDDVEEQVWDSVGAPRERACRSVAGRDSCIMVRYPDCDAYVYLVGGLMRVCLGGIFPGN